MSYEIVKSIKLNQRENNTWFATVTSACNNVYPHYYSKWTYDNKNHDYSKEDLQKDILLDFYYGNFYGGTSTKYGKFVKCLGGFCSTDSVNSKVCNIYNKYDKLRNILREDYIKNKSTTGYYDFGTKDYEMYCNRDSKLKLRVDRELKRYLYQEFKQFKPVCKPTIVKLWSQNGITKEWVDTDIYLRQDKGVRKYASFTNFDNATRFTCNLKLQKIKRIAEHNGYKAEFIEV